MTQAASFPLRWLEWAARLGSAACLITLPLLSLLPATVVERTGAGKNFEHFLAYGGTGLLLGLAIAVPRHRVLAAIGLILVAATLETAQLLTLTRSAELAQFLSGSTGACVGVIAGSVSRTVLTRRIGAPQRL
ncbi:hypothetical protein [Ancylobacter pratisalsi]|uniref:VanZ family protein n=1 Tax=Ancylobacter pratisalsi TaxID=1745854 RepID=A0A6P1YVP0_9HYPH|nr:hypothetical protein [Ancylobacter pratisalsi]QIB35644.1 hypothetical protein G3A50_19490 [Ancylobacter pratisalsi]